MTNDELYAVVDRWFSTGQLSDSDREAVKQEYIRLTGDPGSRCTTCPDFWSDVQITLRIHLKELQFPAMEKKGKYLLAEGTGSIRIPFAATQLMAEGVPSESLKLVSDPENDAFIDQVLEDYPELSEYITVNPAYEKAQAKAQADAKAKAKADADADAQAKAKAEADAKAKADKAAADKAKADAQAKADADAKAQQEAADAQARAQANANGNPTA